jgi:hypothetical protein
VELLVESRFRTICGASEAFVYVSSAAMVMEAVSCVVGFCVEGFSGVGLSGSGCDVIR